MSTDPFEHREHGRIIPYAVPHVAPPRRSRRKWLVGTALLVTAGAVVAVIVGRRLINALLPTGPTVSERMDGAARDYDEHERQKGLRGPYFVEYVSWVDRLRVPLTRTELLEKLGPPDLTTGPAGKTRYVYFYDRFGAKDWYVQVSLSGEHVTEFGYNATPELDRSLPWRSFDDP